MRFNRPCAPTNVSPHEFRCAELVVLGIAHVSIKIKGTRPDKPVICPYCGGRAEITSVNSSLKSHDSPSTGQTCPTAKVVTKVVFPDPDDPSRRPRIRSRNNRGVALRTSARPRRAHKEYDDIHELNGERNNNHWRNSYGYIAEDSAGVDYLGSEGGSSSVRAARGGRADGNRR